MISFCWYRNFCSSRGYVLSVVLFLQYLRSTVPLFHQFWRELPHSDCEFGVLQALNPFLSSCYCSQYIHPNAFGPIGLDIGLRKIGYKYADIATLQLKLVTRRPWFKKRRSVYTMDTSILSNRYARSRNKKDASLPEIVNLHVAKCTILICIKTKTTSQVLPLWSGGILNLISKLTVSQKISWYWLWLQRRTASRYRVLH